MPIEVKILFQDRTVRINEQDTCIFPAQQVIIEITGPTIGEIRLDGRIPRFYRLDGLKLIAPIDLSRSTGFHHLHIEPGLDYWFGTEDAKLKLGGMEAMLRFLSDEGLAWSGQLLFSDGRTIEDPHVIFAWLIQNADRILEAADQILARPRKERRSIVRTSGTARGRLSISGTMAYLRRNGPDALEPHELGPIEYSGRRYSPLRVVTRTSAESDYTVSNRRAHWLVWELRRLVQSVLSSALGPGIQERRRLSGWLAHINGLLGDGIFASISSKTSGAALPVTPTSVELVDKRYWEIFEAVRSLQTNLAWSPTQMPGNKYAFVDFADQIYQLFAVTVLAKTLGCTATAKALGSSQPAFSGNNWELFYDTAPPTNLMRTWRSYSTSPDSQRPDLVFRRRSDGLVVLSDVKYRNNGNRASESSLRELSAYMSSFGFSRALVIYPPGDGRTLTPTTTTAMGQTLAELPICPVAGLLEYLETALIPFLESVAQVPPWRDQG